MDVSPFSLVRFRKAPLSLIEACFEGSPCAHQAPANFEACDPGIWADAGVALQIRRAIVLAEASNIWITRLMERLRLITSLFPFESVQAIMIPDWGFR